MSVIEETSSKARWGVYAHFTRCGKNNMCAKCADDLDEKPHGPYYRIMRSSPDLWPTKQELHIGRLSAPEVEALRNLLPQIDELWPTAVPSKREIKNLIEQEVTNGVR